MRGGRAAAAAALVAPRPAAAGGSGFDVFDGPPLRFRGGSLFPLTEQQQALSQGDGDGKNKNACDYPHKPGLCAYPHTLQVPVDHNATSGKTWGLTYYVLNATWDGTGPLFVSMPGEGGLLQPGQAYPNNPSELCKRFSCLEVKLEHRYFGHSVPLNDTTVSGLRFLSVEQNLADIAALIRHVRADWAVPAAAPSVATGGSYSGASAAWIRTKYPDVVDAAVAESGPVRAVVDFPAYDETIAAALASPAPRCATRMAATARALDAAFAKGAGALKRLFNARNLDGPPQGDTDFLYGLGDATASPVQYGTKKELCAALARPYKGAEEPSDDALLRNFANFTLDSFGEKYFQDCFYDSECMRNTTLAHGEAQSARSWYWMKCSELGYLQTATPAADGAAMRPSALTKERLLKQCRYIFGGDGPPVDEFNARFGGADPRSVGASRVVYLDYSDDPWRAASVNATLAADLPLLFTTCDGCAHCGSGAPQKTLKKLTDEKVRYLSQWLGLLPSPQPAGG